MCRDAPDQERSRKVPEKLTLLILKMFTNRSFLKKKRNLEHFYEIAMGTTMFLALFLSRGFETLLKVNQERITISTVEINGTKTKMAVPPSAKMMSDLTDTST